jgi:hypothetical protein
MSIRANVNGNNLEIRLSGLSVLWTLKKTLSFPLKNVVGATYDPKAVSLPKGFRSPGLHIPRIQTAGSYSVNGERHFWHVSSGKNTVVIRLQDEKYSQLVIEVANAEELISKINS